MKLGDQASVDCNGEKEKNCLKYIRVKESRLSSLSGFHTTFQHGLELISVFVLALHGQSCFALVREKLESHIGCPTMRL